MVGLAMQFLKPILCIFVASLASAASITGVYNAGSWIPASLPNSGVAQGAYFTVTGSGLGPALLVVASSYPLPTTQGLGGTVVQVKVGSVTNTCILYYTSAGQVSAILPSATPTGAGTLTVTYQGATATSAIQVVTASPGLFTLNSAGSGPASITDAVSYQPITMVNAAHPGETVVLWGTGLGAVTGDETEPPAAPSNFPGVQVLIGNQLVTPSYAGRSGYPGLDQINVTIPTGIGLGCKVSVGVVVNGVTGNVVTTSIAAAGQTACDDGYGLLTAANLQKAQGSGALNVATVGLTRFDIEDDTLAAKFAIYPLNSLIRSYGGGYSPSFGSCVVYEVVAGDVLTYVDPIVATLPVLDAGGTLTVTPQGGKFAAVSETSTGTFGAIMGTGSYITPGTWSVSNGNGGSQVGAFNWTETLPNELALSNPPSAIDRSQNLTVSWSGGSAFALISIFGYSAVPLSTGDNSYVEFVCTAAPTATQFTIPAAILNTLPANGYSSSGVTGMGLEIAGVIENRFAAAGSPGLDVGVFTMFTSTRTLAKVQ
jgi:uncharacterized protein (TIGR03437 family)